MSKLPPNQSGLSISLDHYCVFMKTEFYLTHTSLKDYLLAFSSGYDHLFNSSGPSHGNQIERLLSEVPTQGVSAEACIRYLSSSYFNETRVEDLYPVAFPFSNIGIDIESSRTSSSEAAGSLTASKLPSFVKYALNFWGYYYSKACSKGLLTGVLFLFRGKDTKRRMARNALQN